MAKHAADLSIKELAEAGAAAAQQAAARAHAAGLPSAGTIEYFDPAAAASDGKDSDRRVTARSRPRRVSR